MPGRESPIAGPAFSLRTGWCDKEALADADWLELLLSPALFFDLSLTHLRQGVEVGNEAKTEIDLALSVVG